MNFQWMSDELAQKRLAEGFWKCAFYRGVLKFGISGVLILTLLGLIWNGMQTFEMAWWKKGSIGFLLGGFVWGAALWSVARVPQRSREILHWALAFTVVVAVGIYFYIVLGR